MHRKLVTLSLTTLAALPVAGTLASPASAASSTKAQTFKGPTEYVDHGPVQVSIVVKNKKITGVTVTNSPEGGRSVQIQGQAIPILKQETLRAQSASINEVSGATDTSVGYIQSLQAAVKAAKQRKALK